MLAEVKATDLQDEIVLHAVPPDELEELGSALGHAIEMVSDADEAHLDWDDHGASADWTDQPARALVRRHRELPRIPTPGLTAKNGESGH